MSGTPANPTGGPIKAELQDPPNLGATGGAVPAVLQAPAPGPLVVPPAAEFPAGKPTEKEAGFPIPLSWAVGFVAILLVLFGYSYWLSQVGTQDEIDAMVAFSNILIAVAAFFAIYLSARGRSPPQA